MPFIQTHIPNLLVFEPKIFEDSRGYFFESFNLQAFRAEGAVTPNRAAGQGQEARQPERARGANPWL